MPTAQVIYAGMHVKDTPSYIIHHKKTETGSEVVSAVASFRQNMYLLHYGIHTSVGSDLLRLWSGFYSHVPQFLYFNLSSVNSVQLQKVSLLIVY